MKKIVPVFCALSILITLICMALLRQVPSGELWKGYSVLYVPKDADDALVTGALDAAGIFDYTCLSNQYLPLDLSADSLEVKLLSLNPASMDYIARRSNYFFDKNHEYKLYYVPVFYKNKLTSIKNSLKGAGVDSKSTYPFLFPVLVAAFSLILLLFSKKKNLFVFLCVLPVLYTFAFPYLGSVIGCLVLLVLCFVVSNIFGRRDFLKFCLKKYIFFGLLFLALISVSSVNIASALVLILLVVSQIAVFFLYRYIKVVTYKPSRFNPVMIRSSFFIPAYSGKENLVFGFLAGFSLLSIIFSLLTFNVSGSGAQADDKIALPSASAVQKSAELPNLEDYYQWDYMIRTFPQRSLNQDQDFLSPVRVTKYESENGRIVETFQDLSYDQNYKDMRYGTIDSLPFNALEKVLKKQGEDSRAGYSSNGSYRISLFCIIITFVQFSMIVVYFAWILINKEKKMKFSDRGRK